MRRSSRFALARFSFLGLATLVLCTASVQGEENDTSDGDAMDRVRLQAESSKQVANDLMQATLAAEAEERDAAQVADVVNRAMTWALDQARSSKGITLRSGGYQTHPVRREGVTVRWRASQQLLLESRDSERMTALIGELQSRLQLKSLGFAVSQKARRVAEDEMIEAALDRFKERAEIVRKNLGSSGYRIVEISIRTGGPPPVRPMSTMRAMRTGGEMLTPPAVEAGESEVRVSVTGTIQLN